MKYTIFQAPIYSWFKKDFYRSIGLKSHGTGFLYLAVLFAICWTAIILSVYIHLSIGAQKPEVTEFIAKLPNMTFKDGKMSMDKPSPYTIVAGEKKIIFDTGEKVNSIDDVEDAGALLTEDAIMFENQKEPLEWKKFVTDYNLNQEQMKSGLQSLCGYLSLFGLVLGLPVFFGHLFLSMFYAAIGLFVLDKQKLGFETALRMAICAMTPGILLSSVLSVLWINIPFQGLVTVPLTLGLLFFGYSALSGSGSAEQA